VTERCEISTQLSSFSAREKKKIENFEASERAMEMLFAQERVMANISTRRDADVATAYTTLQRP
jgi:hypothetical protein